MTGESLTGRVRAAGRLGLLAVVAAMATWNKEAFFFYVVTLYPILRLSLPRLKAATVVAGLVFVCGCVYLALRVRYAGVPIGCVRCVPAVEASSERTGAGREGRAASGVTMTAPVLVGSGRRAQRVLPRWCSSIWSDGRRGPSDTQPFR